MKQIILKKCILENSINEETLNCFSLYPDHTVFSAISTDWAKYPLSEIYTLQASIEQRSKTNHETIKTISERYQMKINPGICDKSFPISSYTNKSIYSAIKFSLTFGNLTQSLHEFEFDVYNVKNEFNAKLESSNGNIFFHVTYKPVKTDDVSLPKMKWEISSLPIVKEKKAGECIALQHEKLIVNIRLGNDKVKNKTNFNHVAKVVFMYEYFVGDTRYDAMFEYLAWLYECESNSHGRFINLVVDERMSESKIDMIFQDGFDNILAIESYTVTGSETYFMNSTRKESIGLEAGLYSVKDSLIFYMLSYVFLDNFELKKVQCEVFKQKVNSYVVRQFRRTRYIKSFVPVEGRSQKQVFLYRPRTEGEIIDKLINGKTKCDWKEKDLRKLK